MFGGPLDLTDLAQQLFPTCPPRKLVLFVPHLAAALREFRIDTPVRLASWAAQVGHESADLTRWEESFAYRPERLVEVFGRKRFPTIDVARLYAGDSERVANLVYADRMGNGSETSGDGWRYRGRSPIQLTGRDNYAQAGRALDLPLAEQPDLLLLPEHGFRAAGWFWDARHLSQLADAGRFDDITRRINGGTNGAGDRRARHARIRRVLGLEA